LFVECVPRLYIYTTATYDNLLRQLQSHSDQYYDGICLAILRIQDGTWTQYLYSFLIKFLQQIYRFVRNFNILPPLPSYITGNRHHTHSLHLRIFM